MSRTRTKTLDGTRTPVLDLNTDAPKFLQQQPGGLLTRVANVCKNLNLFMAGLYTGVGCSGTPHTHHVVDEAEKKGP
ncbi:MAG: hypothetical protein HQ498_06180 [Pseudohongiella sp.]|nr:hypothetical protein [Pseudohongiella sp.]